MAVAEEEAAGEARFAQARADREWELQNRKDSETEIKD
jgi:hypothetical protein